MGSILSGCWNTWMGHKRNEQGGFVVVIIMLQRVLLKLSTITVVLFVSFLENFFLVTVIAASSKNEVGFSQ